MDPLGEGWAEDETLSDVLLDTSARWDERDDAATDLADSDEPAALEALMIVGRNEEEDDTLLETVGDSIAEILARHPERTPDDIGSLAPAALRGYRSRRLKG